MSARESPGARLRAQLAGDDAVVFPGAMNALIARLIENAGFPGVYMTSPTACSGSPTSGSPR
jgi:2-methylisocitrate lyase-like PEP mutase family enzyme